MAWNDRQVKDLTRAAIGSIGQDGWALLVPRLREAVIYQAALSAVRTQDRPAVKVSDIDHLVSAMLAEAGL